MRASLATVLMGILLTAVSLTAQDPIFDPHGDPDTGALRVTTDPPSRGECQQCHPQHGDPFSIELNPPLLFTENRNELAFWSNGDGPCHGGRPFNYPLSELNRMPETARDPGYFEDNVGGVRRVGVEYRGRWPGPIVYTSPAQTADGKLISPHAQDPDMPLRDDVGEGLCANCHDSHGTPNRDLLRERYGGVGGANAVGAPAEYRLCLSCHGADGPPGMEPENRFIEDYYDAGLNGETAGHQIRRDPEIALSWPAHIRVGDMLPCYDCHNPHGSEGNNGAQPNAYVLSDQRDGWSGLTDTRGNPAQSRRFCLGCHIPSDGVPGSQEVGGIVMNTLSSRGPHLSTATQGCHQCHGGDYSGPTSLNVHHPAEDPGDVRNDPWIESGP